jgi:transglutaminase-like putative cysteine protease
MKLRIVHTTRIGYPVPVRSSFNEARMTPLTLPSQITMSSRVLACGAAPVRTYRDYWGSHVSVFELSQPHSELLVEATAIVETRPLAPVPAGADGSGRLAEYLLATPLTTLDAEVAGGSGVHETAAAICAAVRDRVRFVPGATRVGTTAQQAWDQGSGVCQDIAHVTVAMLRAVSIPARYVSGYLYPAPGWVGTVQTHAWAEYWAGGWVPCDPTSGEPVGERHVVVARGRDYADVPPLKGTYHGPPDSVLSVRVEITRLA